MTVQELIDVDSFCDLAEIVVRENGFSKWIQGYRIGKNAKIYPSELTAEIREKMQLESHQRGIYECERGEVFDVNRGNSLPMKVICKNVKKLPDNIANLQVAEFVPRRLWQLHGEALVSNAHELEIWAYPEGYVPESEPKHETKQMEGQIEMELII